MKFNGEISFLKYRLEVVLSGPDSKIRTAAMDAITSRLKRLTVVSR
jgi:hypothetical protein